MRKGKDKKEKSKKREKGRVEKGRKDKRVWLERGVEAKIFLSLHLIVSALSGHAL